MDSTRIGFYNPPTDIIKNTSNLFEFNPGISGTRYITSVLIKTLLLNKKYIVCDYYYPTKLQEAISIFDKNGGGIFIATIREPVSFSSKEFSSTKIIVWNHCDYDKKTLKSVERMNPYANVFLTRPAMNTYILSPLIDKSVIIGNFTQTYTNLKREEGNNVTYIGALYPFKHCDVLTKAWPKVIKKIPDARLIIIGASTLYSTGREEGSLNLTTSKYEKELLYPLIKHNCMDTVKFGGLMDGEKIHLTLLKTNIGIVNPIGTTETFCTSAIEFGAHGIPVIGGDYGGLKETLPLKCGYRVKNHKQLAKKIIKLLKDKSRNISYGKHYKLFVDNNYSLLTFQNNWIKFLDSCISNNPSYIIVKHNKYLIAMASFFRKTRLFLYRIKHYVWRKFIK